MQTKIVPSVFPHSTSLFDLPGIWKIAHVRSRQEKALAQDLVEANIGFCCPFQKVRVPRKDCGGTRDRLIPVFSCYLAFISSEDAVRTIQKTGRVVRTIPVFNQKRLIAELESILIACRQGKSLHPVQYQDHWVGQTVQVMEGPMRGCKGTVCRIKDERCLVVSVEMFRQSVVVEISSTRTQPCADNLDDGEDAGETIRARPSRILTVPA